MASRSGKGGQKPAPQVQQAGPAGKGGNVANAMAVQAAQDQQVMSPDAQMAAAAGQMRRFGDRAIDRAAQMQPAVEGTPIRDFGVMTNNPLSLQYSGPRNGTETPEQTAQMMANQARSPQERAASLQSELQQSQQASFDAMNQFRQAGFQMSPTPGMPFAQQMQRPQMGYGGKGGMQRPQRPMRMEYGNPYQQMQRPQMGYGGKGGMQSPMQQMQRPQMGYGGKGGMQSQMQRPQMYSGLGSLFGRRF
jgi:hypothetical protein